MKKVITVSLFMMIIMACLCSGVMAEERVVQITVPNCSA